MPIAWVWCGATANRDIFCSWRQMPFHICRFLSAEELEAPEQNSDLLREEVEVKQILVSDKRTPQTERRHVASTKGE
jgi:hypothetical protein